MLAVLASAMLTAGAAGAQQHDPWELLGEMRRALADDGSRTATFEQLFTPAGFSEGEREGGRLYLDLPSCVRWDYDEPYPKAYLLCGSELYSWNPGEPAGRLFVVDRESQPGLDLLLLSVPRLRQRYEATVEPAEDGRLRVLLQPLASSVGGLRDVMIELGPTGSALLGLSYADGEGNRTAFSFGPTEPLDEPGHFAPPPGMLWERQGPATDGSGL